MGYIKLRIGVIGCGYMAQSAHIPCLAGMEEVQLAAVYDPRREVAEKVAKRWGFGLAAVNIEELFNNCEAVLVLSSVQFHCSLIKQAIKAGKHVFTEKPLTMFASSATLLAENADDAGISLQVGYMKQHEGNIVKYLNKAAKSDWGKMLFVRTHSFIGKGWTANINRLYNVIKGDTPTTDLSQAESAPAWLPGTRDNSFYSFANPYYALLDPSCHSVNMLRFVTGKDMQVSWVQNTEPVRQIGFDIDGTPAVMEFCVNFSMQLWDEVTELYYEKATVKIMTPPPLAANTSAIVEIYSEETGQPQTTVLSDTKHWAFANQLSSFVNTIQNGETVNNGHEASKDIGVIENIFKHEHNIG